MNKAPAFQPITLGSGARAMTAELHAPAHAVGAGLVVILYGSDGLTDHLTGPWKTMIRGYASDLAEKGFCAVIPDYLSVTKTNPGQDVYGSMATNMGFWQSALSDAMDQAVIATKADPRRVGLLGFSLGGHLALRLRCKAKVLVEFFAPAFDGIGTPGTLTHAQIHHGKADEMVATGFPNAAAIKAQLANEGTATELCGYDGARHGFIGADPDNTHAREESKTRTLAFFQSFL
jgi:dienelactone hydrolase